MEWTRFDTRLQGLIVNGAERTADHAPQNPHGTTLQATCQKMLEEARGLLAPAVSRAQQENHEAYRKRPVDRRV